VTTPSHAPSGSATARMHTPFDQLGKEIVGRTMVDLGEMRREHEVAGHVQRVDLYFEPAPDKAARRRQRGMFGRIAETACLIEVFRSTPSIRVLDGCLRKQLTLDHLTACDAHKAKKPSPHKPRLWVLSTGKPEAALQGYGFAQKPGWSAGVYEAMPAAVVSVVVLHELPRVRDTLLLRLLGKGPVMAQALDDLEALPPDAWERDVAQETLVALRFQMPEDSSTTDEERRFVMAMNEIYEQWKKRTIQEGLAQGVEQGVAQGVEQGLRQALVASYQTRFGEMPAALRKVLDETSDSQVLTGWVSVLAVRSEKEIAEALLAKSARPPRRPRTPSRRSPDTR
jgi:hypothetical protein